MPCVGFDDARVTKNETLVRRGKKWSRTRPDKQLFKRLQKTHDERRMPRISSPSGSNDPGKPKGKTARNVELYSTAYKLALEQIPALQMREKPDISLRIHASIRRQLKAGETDPRRIAFNALKDVLVPDTH